MEGMCFRNLAELLTKENFVQYFIRDCIHVPDMKPRMAQLIKLKTTKGERVNIIESIAPVWKDVRFFMDLDPEGQKVNHIEAKHAQKPNGLHICCRWEIFSCS